MAGVGVWGFNPLSQTVVDPAVNKDVMSYCRPHFISDYNYNKLLTRLTYVNTAAAATMADRAARASTTGEPLQRAAYRFVEVGGDGSLVVGDRVELTEAPGGEPRTARIEDGSGKTVAETTAHFIEYDHLPGGFLFVPEQAAGFQNLSVDGLGRTR